MITFIFMIIGTVLFCSVIFIFLEHVINIINDDVIKGSNIKCGGDMILNNRRIPKRKDLDIKDLCVSNGRFVITYTDGSTLVGDDDPDHDMFTKG